jgi:chemotaxis protein CheD
MLVLDHGFGKINSHRGEQVFLLPGQWYFGANGAIVRTLLGSCVALTLWHPHRHMGGMCHYLLPTRTRPPSASLDGRFAEEAVELLVSSMARTGTKPGEYLVDLYGGADTMPDQAHVHKFNIGERNIEKALELVERYGFQLQTVDVGGNEPRNVTLDMKSGQVELKRGKPAGSASVASSAVARTPAPAPARAPAAGAVTNKPAAPATRAPLQPLPHAPHTHSRAAQAPALHSHAKHAAPHAPGKAPAPHGPHKSHAASPAPAAVHHRPLKPKT